MRFYVAVTDGRWFRFLRSLKPAPQDINFWQPSARQPARLERCEPFLFKLHAPENRIAGLGFFSTYINLNLKMTWDAFQERNGAESFERFSMSVMRYQSATVLPYSIVGCNILTDPVFFDDDEMIPAPSDWASNIVRGKYYSTEDPIGARLWGQVMDRLEKRRFLEREDSLPDMSFHRVAPEPRWTRVFTKVRIGQDAFRFMVTDAYRKACAVTADHTLPVLEAAHIKPFSAQGPYTVSNGILLRADLHKLFDDGYMTITPDYHIEVSRLLREEFHNGRIYYELHGRPLANLPDREADRPDRAFLQWHNEQVYRAG